MVLNDLREIKVILFLTFSVLRIVVVANAEKLPLLPGGQSGSYIRAAARSFEVWDGTRPPPVGGLPC